MNAECGARGAEQEQTQEKEISLLSVPSVTSCSILPGLQLVEEPRAGVGPERRLNPGPKQSRIRTLPLTVEQIVEEARNWPPEKVGELVGRLTEDLHASDPETQAAWKTEVDRRVQEIQSGKLQGIPGEEVSARIRKIIGR